MNIVPSDIHSRGSKISRVLMAVHAIFLVCIHLPAAAAPDEATVVRVVADEWLAYLRETDMEVRSQSALPIEAFDAITFEQAQRKARTSRQLLEQLEAVSVDALPDASWLLAKVMRQSLLTAADSVENYWLDFAVTPYAGGLRIKGAHAILAEQPLHGRANLDHYLQLLDAYAAMCDQLAAKTRAQAERGIRVAKPAIPGVIALFDRLREGASDTLVPSTERLSRLSAGEVTAFQSAVRERIRTRIIPAYRTVTTILDEDYVRSAPDEVGLSRYPGGRERYRRIIREDTGLDLKPQDIHALGLRRVNELETQMESLRGQIGFKGTRAAFHQMLLTDPRFLARTPQEAGDRLMGHLKRMEPHIPKYFSRVPAARCDVKPLAPALAKGQTFGFYAMPTPTDPVGYYHYNASDLENRSMVGAAHLIFHELLPGHHLQLALQLENSDAHPVRKFLGDTAFVEGWAEYAASLGKELGVFSDPYDLYGQIAWEVFFATRLVVDTGMNELGWPLERARSYMKDHVLNSDTEIASETLRYSTDLFGQALSYRLGYEKFWELRHRAEKALGPEFDIRLFHATAINQGSMPLNVLEDSIDRLIAQRRR